MSKICHLFVVSLLGHRLLGLEALLDAFDGGEALLPVAGRLRVLDRSTWRAAAHAQSRRFVQLFVDLLSI